MEREETRKEGDGLEVLIITGLSGAGKTQAANCLEDMGYFCVDNLPPALIPKFTELVNQSEGRIRKVALVLDVRGGRFFQDLFKALEETVRQGIVYRILFLEATEEVLVARFKESRRRHPLSRNGELLESIRREKEMLEDLRGRASLIIDTSNLTVHQLKEELLKLYGPSKTGLFNVTAVSFGYKFGLPSDADIVMDVRFLPNPNYVDELSELTGEDQRVAEYVMKWPVTQDFLSRFVDLLEFLLPCYAREGKSHLVLAIGCTGGQHRSVVLTEYVGKKIADMGYETIVKHRDLPRYKERKR